MRTTWKVALVVIGGLVGCAASGGGDADGTSTNGPPDSNTPINQDAGSDASSIDPIHLPPDAAADACTDPDGCDEPQGPTNLPHGTKTCAAAANAHTAYATVTYDTTGSTISLTMLESLVKNSMGRDGNSLVVAVKEKSSSSYLDQFQSGPILTNNVKTSVPVPANWTIQAGDTIRITTTFDEGSPLDPFVPCYIKF